MEEQCKDAKLLLKAKLMLGDWGGQYVDGAHLHYTKIYIFWMLTPSSKTMAVVDPTVECDIGV